MYTHTKYFEKLENVKILLLHSQATEKAGSPSSNCFENSQWKGPEAVS